MWETTIESIEQVEKDAPGLGGCLAHVMGLGKTLQVCAVVESVGSIILIGDQLASNS